MGLIFSILLFILIFVFFIILAIPAILSRVWKQIFGKGKQNYTAYNTDPNTNKEGKVYISKDDHNSGKIVDKSVGEYVDYEAVSPDKD